MADSLIEDDVQTPAAPKTPEERLAEKDALITQLQNEKQALEVESRSRKSVEELAEEIFSRAAPRQPVQDRNTNPPANEPNAPEGGKQVDLKAAIKQVLEEDKRRTSIESNIAASKAKLIETYGADYKTTLTQAAAKLGVNTRFLDDLAGSSPDGLLNVLKTVAAPDPNRPAAPPQSTQGVPRPDVSVRKNAAYFRELRKNNLTQYLSKQVQAEMHRQALEQGEAFYQ